ncbi:hypothetical protein MPER_05399 [Moniliophthora perniciosa FA553]|nr:hypothetical protein MPER_05399 [Moniliophthora perniciosa FA553]
MSYATQLDGWIVGGRKVKASFQKPSINQRRSFTAIVNGLPAHNLNWRNYLLKHSKATSIDISKAVPLVHEDVCRRAKTILERHGIVDSFDVLAPDPSKSKTVAFANFTTAEAASAAVAFLNGEKCTELENSPLWIELVFSVKYSVPALRFSCIRIELDTLRDAHIDAKIGYYDRNEHGAPIPNVILRVYGADAKAVARLKLSVEPSTSGERRSSAWELCYWIRFLSQRRKDFLEAR